MLVDVGRVSEIQRSAPALKHHTVPRKPVRGSGLGALLRVFGAVVICTALFVTGAHRATAQKPKKPTTHDVHPEESTPKPSPAAGEHVTPSHLESSGPDCFGADKDKPICGPARITPYKPIGPRFPPMDLVWTSLDLTGWPLNPKWEWQTEPGGLGKAAPAVDLCGKFHEKLTPISSPTPDSFGPPSTVTPPTMYSVSLELGHPPCTNTPLKLDSDSGFWADLGSIGGLCESSIPGSVNGHVNWMPATFTGPISYESHDDATFHDGDYNLQLVPTDKAALTAGETHSIKVEFKDEETVDRFVTPFWTSGELGSLRGNYAIVTGVLGLDGVHDFDSELHPAYLVAIRTRDPDSPRGASYPERWAFFVRNWGNEGMCSHIIWQAGVKVWVFKLPWRPSAKSVKIEEDLRARNAGSFYDIRPLEGDGIVVAVYLGEPSAKNVVHGEIALYWDETAPAARVLPQNPQRPSIGARPVGDAAQERLDQAIARMPGESKARFAAAVGARKITPRKDEEKAVRRPMTFSIPTASIWTGPTRNTLLQPVEDSAAIERTKRMVQALCEAYRGNVPQFPKLCQKR